MLRFFRQQLSPVAPSTRYSYVVGLIRQRLQRAPAWALLSLAINTVLFITVLVLVKQGPNRPAQLAKGNAFASEDAETVASVQLGERHYLEYQQWVDLLQQEAAAIATSNPPHQTVLLGDSISLWFPPKLLPGHKTWINQAISGEDSSGLLQRLPLLDNTNPETIFLMIGINDLIWGTSPEELLANAEAIVQYLRTTHPEARLVVQSILPHGGQNASWEGRERLEALPSTEIQAVNAQLETIAEVNGALYLDLFPLFVDGNGNLRADLTTDGLHLNQQGYLVWRSAIALINETDLIE